MKKYIIGLLIFLAMAISACGIINPQKNYVEPERIDDVEELEIVELPQEPEPEPELEPEILFSNMERLLFSLCDEKVEKVRELMTQLSSEGIYEISSSSLENMKGFYGYYASESETAETVREMYKASGYIIDTHTAVAYTAYKKYIEQNPKDSSKTVIVSTASPYKFTTDVMKSINSKYSGFNDFTLMDEMHKLMGTKPPKTIRDLDKIPVLHKTVCEKDEMKKEVEKILEL